VTSMRSRIIRVCSVATLLALVLAGPVAPTFIAPQPVRATGPVEVTFTTPGGNGWTVPADVTEFSFVLVGGKGGKGGYADSPGGFGARLEGTLSVTPGTVFNLHVGGNGTDYTTPSYPPYGGLNGGGAGSSSGDIGGGGGGGASDLKSSDGTLVLIAGGGGGGGGHDTNATGDFAGGTGGNAGLAGGISSGNGPNGGGGQEGSLSAGGTGGQASAGAVVGQNGTSGSGGSGGAAASSRAGAGGGGGGGYYGGGGGGGGGETFGLTGAGGGGGGGSSYRGNVPASITTDATGTPIVKISYKTPQSITFPAIADTALGTADFDPGATASSGLPITYYASGTCSIVAARVHLGAVGSCTVMARQFGDATYGQAVAVARTFNVTKQPQTIAFAAPSPKIYGSADFAAGATASSGLAVTYAATGACSMASANIHINAAGSCTVTASQAGNATYAAATNVANTFTVAPASTSVSALTVALASGNPTAQFSDSVTLTATVNVPATATGNGAFSGNLLFRINGKPAAGVSASVSNSAPTASVTLRLDEAVIAAGGTYGASAEFVPAAGSNYGGSTSAVQTVVVKGEGLTATGGKDGSTSLEYAGPASVALNAAPILSARLRQSLSPETADKQYIDYGRVSVSAVFRIYQASCTTKCTPVWTSPAVLFANNGDWLSTGIGLASTSGPGTLSRRSYRVEVSLSAQTLISADLVAATLSVGSGTGGFLGDGSGSETIRLLLVGLFALVGLAVIAFYVLRRRRLLRRPV
jgi:hypothetical protein